MSEKEPAPYWAKGHDLEFLRDVRKLYLDQFKPYVYSQFGVLKESAIADAINDDRLAWSKDENGKVKAVVYFKIAKKLTRQKDFRGDQFTIQAGDLQIRLAAGYKDYYLTELILKLIMKVGSTRVTWLELHAEHPATPGIAADLGFELVTTKIAASSDMMSIYIRNEKPENRMLRPLSIADSPALKLVNQPLISQEIIKDCLEEIKAYDPVWEQHYSSYNKRKSWTAIALQGFDREDPNFIIKPTEMSRPWKKENPERLLADCGPTEAAEKLPTLWKLAHTVPGKPERIRLMKLRQTNGELSRHADITDRDAGTEDGKIARFHIPLQTNEACKFSGWELNGERTEKHFPVGSLFYLDIRKPHAVVNGGEIDRIHLVVDVACNDETRSLLHD